jgi:hypothetical protein
MPRKRNDLRVRATSSVAIQAAQEHFLLPFVISLELEIELLERLRGCALPLTSRGSSSNLPPRTIPVHGLHVSSSMELVSVSLTNTRAFGDG